MPPACNALCTSNNSLDGLRGHRPELPNHEQHLGGDLRAGQWSVLQTKTLPAGFLLTRWERLCYSLTALTSFPWLASE